MHTLLDLRGNIPTFIHVTTGDVHDVNILDQIIPQAGATDASVAGIDLHIATIAKPELVYPETMRSSRREHQRVATFHDVDQDIGTLVSL